MIYHKTQNGTAEPMPGQGANSASSETSRPVQPISESTLQRLREVIAREHARDDHRKPL